MNARNVIAYDLNSNTEYHFDSQTAPIYAVAYAYCTNNNLSSAFFAACQDSRLEAFYRTLPITIGVKYGSIACGDWSALAWRVPIGRNLVAMPGRKLNTQNRSWENETRTFLRDGSQAAGTYTEIQAGKRDLQISIGWRYLRYWKELYLASMTWPKKNK